MSKYAIAMKRTAWELLPQGNYTLELTDVRDGPVFQNKRGEDKATIKLILQVAKGPQKGMEVSALINPLATGPRSNSRRWGEALSGQDFDDGDLFDPEAFIGQQVWAKVEIAPDSQNVERNRITVVMPVGAPVGALEAQTNGVGTAAPRRVASAAPAPEPDRELELPEPEDDPGWDAMQPPPPDDGEGAR